MEVVFIVVALAVLWAGSCVRQEVTIDQLCDELIAEQTTLADSLSVAQAHEECEWWDGASETPEPRR